jgi:hypothetical protein
MVTYIECDQENDVTMALGSNDQARLLFEWEGHLRRAGRAHSSARR